MLRILTLILFLPIAALADPMQIIVEEQILPGFGNLERKAEELDTAARADCTPKSTTLRAAYHETFDAWIAVSHLRFGPSETENRAFALAFWPDPKGATERTLARLIADQDPIVENPEEFKKVSVAVRGLYALEHLLYGEMENDTPYGCAIIQAITRDISTISSQIATEWRTSFAQLMLTAGKQGNQRYFTKDEATRELFTALSSGVEFLATMRLGRPLGSFDRPRPRRAEARRSGRSLRNVTLSLEAMRPFALALVEGADPEVIDRLTFVFDRAIQQAKRLDDPVFSGVSQPLSRVRIEALSVAISSIGDVLTTDLAPELGVVGGFNSMDGD